MSEAVPRHRLDGLEPDNLLAFLVMLGLLRSLEATPKGKNLLPRICWQLDSPPLRPELSVNPPVTREEVAAIADEGIQRLKLLAEFPFSLRALFKFIDEQNKNHKREKEDAKLQLSDLPNLQDLLEEQKQLDYSSREARSLLGKAAYAATYLDRGRADLLASLMSDAAVKHDKNPDAAPIAPTPLCLLFGQGHQHFLDRFRNVPADPAPPRRGRGKAAVQISAEKCLSEALFEPWHRSDPTFSFRWDPEEDVRYALMAGDPAAPAYKLGTQHGANRLAAVGLAALTLVPKIHGGSVRPSIIGGSFSRDGFSFSWPIWREPATLAAIRAMLGHPDLLKPNGLVQLGVDHVLTAKRISVGEFMNFTRAQAPSPT